MSRVDQIIKTVATCSLLLGYGLITLPFIADQYSRIDQNASILSYQEDINSMSEQEKAQALQACTAYNEDLAKLRETEYYHYNASQEYDSTYANWPFADSDMGTLIIPSINISLPIGHGTDEQTLQVKAGHLYGTSLPCGGESTHTVISGHSGLRSSQMFDRIEELELGDKVYIEVLGKTLEYQVIDINVVVPEEHDAYMQIEEGKDLLTLYTCTPYGINSHRLLVKCEHINTYDNVSEQQDAQVELSIHSNRPYLWIAGVWGIPTVLAIVGISYIWRKD